MAQLLTYFLISLLSLGIAFVIHWNARNRWNRQIREYLSSIRDALLGKNEVAKLPPAANEEVDKEIRGIIAGLAREGASEEIVSSDHSTPQPIQKKLNNTLIINELGQRITSSLLLSETMNHLSETLKSMMDAANVELGVYNKDREDWTVFGDHGQNYPPDYHNHVAEWVLKNNRKVVLQDVERDFGRYVDAPLKAYNGQVAQSLLAFPIPLEKRVGGVITVISFRKNAFDEYHESSIEQLIGFLSVAIQNSFTHQQLNLLRIRAEESEKHEQQFLANMSHEIRTPMNAVLGMTNLLLDTELNPKQIKYLKAINTSSKNLLVIINDILDISKLEAGKMEIEKIPFRIRDVIDVITQTNRFKIEEKGLAFEMSISPDIPEVVKGDPTRLNQILTNLVSNAVKFTDRGKVTISVEHQPGSHFVRFRVIDTGIGIPKDKQHLLFGNFKQVDSSTFRKYGGTGLGLAISKTLIELQGGKVEVNSEPGKGSEFVVSIPYQVGTVEEVEALHNETGIDCENLTGIRILVAEDNEYNQIVVNDTLENLIRDVHIEIAENGLVTLEMLKKNDYDLILMDAHMPEMDGLECTRQIRLLEDEKKRSIPIIALTASVHKADIDKCLNSGMNDFVPKPFTREEMLNSLVKFYSYNGKRTNSTNDQKAPDQDQTVSGKPIQNGAESEAAEGITNLNYLRDFTKNDRGRMVKYITLYLKLLPENMEKIHSAMQAQDQAQLVKVLHAMSPHLKYMGMNQTADVLSGIENQIRNGDIVGDIDAKVGRIISDCESSKLELEKIVDELT